MSVHLKSGCFDNAMTSSACATLLAQGPTPFILLGDLNRQLTQPNDQLWADLDDGDPPQADLTALTQNMPISCRDNENPEFIDHLVVDPWVLPWVDHTSFRHVTYRQADKGDWDKISDYCPVQVKLWVRYDGTDV